MLDLRICNHKYTENRISCKRFQISKLVEIQRFHKISGSLYEISSELRTPRRPAYKDGARMPSVAAQPVKSATEVDWGTTFSSSHHWFNGVQQFILILITLFIDFRCLHLVGYSNRDGNIVWWAIPGA